GGRGGLGLGEQRRADESSEGDTKRQREQGGAGNCCVHSTFLGHEWEHRCYPSHRSGTPPIGHVGIVRRPMSGNTVHAASAVRTADTRTALKTHGYQRHVVGTRPAWYCLRENGSAT